MTITKTSSYAAEWQVIRLYYNDPIVNFLIKSLKPFIDGLVTVKISDRYYWKRSEENGRHVKLFVRCSEEFMEKLVKPNLTVHFNLYVESKPSVRTSYDENNFPDNSLIFHNYLPDENEWGGLVGLPIAERFFQASSNAILHQFSMKGDYLSAEQILETAIVLHLGFLKATNLKPPDIVTFYENLFFQIAGESVFLSKFESFFEKQNIYLRYFIETTWHTLREEALFLDNNYNQWLKDCVFVNSDLKNTYSLRTQSQLAHLSELWDFYGRLLRFVNNQLGLQDKNESLFFYIMIRSFEMMQD